MSDPDHEAAFNAQQTSRRVLVWSCFFVVWGSSCVIEGAVGVSNPDVTDNWILPPTAWFAVGFISMSGVSVAAAYYQTILQQHTAVQIFNECTFAFYTIRYMLYGIMNFFNDEAPTIPVIILYIVIMIYAPLCQAFLETSRTNYTLAYIFLYIPILASPYTGSLACARLFFLTWWLLFITYTMMHQRREIFVHQIISHQSKTAELNGIRWSAEMEVRA